MKIFEKIFGELKLFLYRINLNTLEIDWSVGNMKHIIGFDPVAANIHPKDFAERYYHPKDRSLMNERIQLFQSGKLESWSGIYRIKHLENHWVWVYSKLQLISPTNSGSDNYVYGLIVDAASELQTKQQLSYLIKEAVRLKHAEGLRSLTMREITIIKHIAEGESYTTIGAKLNIHPETVNSHRKNILHKLKLKNIATLICFAKETGII